jgi:hypothetical protein
VVWSDDGHLDKDYTMVKVKFYSLTGKFTVINELFFDNQRAAETCVLQYAAANKFTSVKFVSDEDYEIRATATTPNGRAGRNIARIELGW